MHLASCGDYPAIQLDLKSEFRYHKHRFPISFKHISKAFKSNKNKHCADRHTCIYLQVKTRVLGGICPNMSTCRTFNRSEVRLQHPSSPTMGRCVSMPPCHGRHHGLGTTVNLSVKWRNTGTQVQSHERHVHGK